MFLLKVGIPATSLYEFLTTQFLGGAHSDTYSDTSVHILFITCEAENSYCAVVLELRLTSESARGLLWIRGAGF